jgi:uncharacterized protein YlzI (FlbEa/FlbD family)
LLVGASALAKSSRTVSLPYAGTLGGTKVEPGRYQLDYVQHSPEATVTLTTSKKVIVTTQGKIVERPAKYNQNAVVYETRGDGSQYISEIRLGGTNQAIVFTE